MARRSRSKIDQSPLSVTSSNVILGLGYTHDLRTVAQAIALLRSDEITGTLFLGVVLEGSKGARALKQFEDASAEIAATTPVGRSRTRRAQR